MKINASERFFFCEQTILLVFFFLYSVVYLLSEDILVCSDFHHGNKYSSEDRNQWVTAGPGFESRL